MGSFSFSTNYKGDIYMSNFNLLRIANSLRVGMVKHSPEILTGIGIAGMVVSTVLAVKATPKALQLIEEEKNKQLDTDSEETSVVKDLNTIDVVKATWKCYIPTVVTGAVSMACIIGANSVNLKRNAALAAAYTLSDTALREYREKVIETIGDKKERAVRDKVAEEKLKKDPVETGKPVVMINSCNTRCYDVITKQRFTSDIETIRRIVNDLNERMIGGEDYISLNDFYYELGLEPVRIGDELGWNISNGTIKLDFSSQLDTDGTPCLVIDYIVAPKRGFSSYE